MNANSAPANAPLTLPHRLWRGIPPALRRSALAQATAWLAPKPNPGATAEGIAIAGEFSQASGLGEGARLMAAAARQLDLQTWTIDLPPLVGRQKTTPHPQTAVPPAGVPLVNHANAPTLPLALLREAKEFFELVHDQQQALAFI